MAPQYTTQITPSPPAGTGASTLHPPNAKSGVNLRPSYGSTSREALAGPTLGSQFVNHKRTDLSVPSVPCRASTESSRTVGPDASSVAGSSKATEAGVSAADTRLKSYVTSTISSFASPFFGFMKARDQSVQKHQENPGPAFQSETWNHPKEIQDVKVEELKDSDILIALMGPTGSGKSSFISTVVGEDKGIGHNLSSHTSGVNAIRVRFPGENANLVLVDTPGFDDTHKSDYQILEIVSNWLKETGSKNIYLDGVLYLHRISDNRMAGTPLRNLDIFEKICGSRWFSKVILVTTMWDELDDDDTGVTREQELRESFWKLMITRGSTTERHKNTSESAWHILHQVLKASRQYQRPQLQKETVEKGRALPSTDAGHELYTQLDDLDKKRKALMRTLQQQMNKPGTDPEIVNLLQAQHSDLERTHHESTGDLTALKVAAPQRFLKSLGMKARHFMS